MGKKFIYAAMAATSFLLGNVVFAQSKKEKEVASAVELMRKTMVDPDSATLDHLTLTELMYGHSGGKVEDKATFIQTLITGKSDFVAIDLTDQAVKVVKNTAVVHHIFAAQTNDGGKPGTVKLAIMMVWQKDKGKWKLLSRQAVRL